MSEGTATDVAVSEKSAWAGFDVATLRDIKIERDNTGALAMMLTSMAQAMELAKVLAASTIMVPKHVQGKPAVALGIVMQAMRWNADPYSVALKSYLVNDQLAYEAQLIAAVVNTMAPLEGRLHPEITGSGEEMVCTVTGKIKGDDRDKVVTQELSTLKTRNSPLWKSSPRQQLAYYTQRLWARLHTPEVLLGIYAPEELADGGHIGPERARDVTPARKPAAETVTVDAEPEEPFTLYAMDGGILEFEDAEAFLTELHGLIGSLLDDKDPREASDMYEAHSAQFERCRALGLDGRIEEIDDLLRSASAQDAKPTFDPEESGEADQAETPPADKQAPASPASAPSGAEKATRPEDSRMAGQDRATSETIPPSEQIAQALEAARRQVEEIGKSPNFTALDRTITRLQNHKSKTWWPDIQARAKVAHAIKLRAQEFRHSWDPGPEWDLPEGWDVE